MTLRDTAPNLLPELHPRPSRYRLGRLPGRVNVAGEMFASASRFPLK